MTIVDIAKEAGYSVSTVSRVLNGRRDVSEEARDRIMRIVEAYQFVPNNNAKHLKQTVSQSILILVKGTSNMLFTNIIEVIQDTIEGSDYSLRVHYLDEDADEVKEAVRMCREHKPMGILFLVALSVSAISFSSFLGHSCRSGRNLLWNKIIFR